MNDNLMLPDRTHLDDVLDRQDFNELLRLLDAGADVNECTLWGSLLKRGILRFETHPRISELVVELLRRGADPKMLTADRSGPLFSAVIIQNTEVLRLLLEAGAQPNEEWEEPESLYDWAEFDYRFEEYDLELPEEPSPQDRQSEDAWLLFLQRLAIAHGKRPPDYLRLLRDYGARTSRELKTEGVPNSDHGGS